MLFMTDLLIRGGHGGVAPILRQVPLIVYKRGSKIRSKVGQTDKMYSNLGKFAQISLRYADIAPTITALLNLPAPRQSLGTLIEEALLFVPDPELHWKVQI